MIQKLTKIGREAHGDTKLTKALRDVHGHTKLTKSGRDDQSYEAGHEWMDSQCCKI